MSTYTEEVFATKKRKLVAEAWGVRFADGWYRVFR